MNTKDEVMQAFDDYQKGLLGSIPAEHATVPHGGVRGETTADDGK
jgi:hypothetical protein